MAEKKIEGSPSAPPPSGGDFLGLKKVYRIPKNCNLKLNTKAFRLVYNKIVGCDITVNLPTMKSVWIRSFITRNILHQCLEKFLLLELKFYYTTEICWKLCLPSNIMAMSEPPPRRSPSHEGDSEARDIIHPVMANITTTHHYGLKFTIVIIYLLCNKAKLTKYIEHLSAGETFPKI